MTFASQICVSVLVAQLPGCPGAGASRAGSGRLSLDCSGARVPAFPGSLRGSWIYLSHWTGHWSGAWSHTHARCHSAPQVTSGVRVSIDRAWGRLPCRLCERASSGRAPGTVTQSRGAGQAGFQADPWTAAGPREPSWIMLPGSGTCPLPHPEAAREGTHRDVHSCGPNSMCWPKAPDHRHALQKEEPLERMGRAAQPGLPAATDRAGGTARAPCRRQWGGQHSRGSLLMMGLGGSQPGLPAVMGQGAQPGLPVDDDGAGGHSQGCPLKAQQRLGKEGPRSTLLSRGPPLTQSEPLSGTPGTCSVVLGEPGS